MPYILNPRGRDPVYVQLAAILEREIRSGNHPADERLPSESELMAQFEVGRNTVRAALAYLRERGIVETIAKRGTFPVKDLPPQA